MYKNWILSLFNKNLLLSAPSVSGLKLKFSDPVPLYTAPRTHLTRILCKTSIKLLKRGKIALQPWGCCRKSSPRQSQERQLSQVAAARTMAMERSRAAAEAARWHRAASSTARARRSSCRPGGRGAGTPCPTYSASMPTPVRRTYPRDSRPSPPVSELVTIFYSSFVANVNNFFEFSRRINFM